MGSFLSCCEGGEDQHCNQTDACTCRSCCSHERETTTVATVFNSKIVEQYKLRPLFGEYKCSCGRKWLSRRSWPSRYQICKRCRRQVFPHTQRELRSSDINRDRENAQDHLQELCQMCKELGYYCGKLRY